MGPGLLALALVGAPLQQTPDTTTYSSPAAQGLVARAMARHRAQDSSVADYQARLRYRLTAGFGRRRWGDAPPVAAEEQEARVAWQLPNDLRVEIIGQRSRIRESGAALFSNFDAPWFVPRGLSDSVRIFGTDFPERAALHPLAGDGPDWYRYAAGDTVSLVMGDGGGRRLQLTEMRVTPKRPGPALIAGKLWLDLATAEVVRLAFRYVGTDLWETPNQPTRKDSAEARRANRLINKFLSIEADLEYALQDGRYWMPYRQVLSGRVQIPLVSDLYVPFEAVTTFSDYEINTGRPVAFRLPPPPPDSLRQRSPAQREARRDSLRAERRDSRPDSTRPRERAGLLPGGGRYEIWRAPRDSLHRYADWGDPLRLRVTEADDRRLRETRREIADLVEGLPRGVTGIDRSGFSYERLADVFRFNRVQGTSFGAGYQLDLRGLRYTSLYGTARFGLADKHPTARVALVRDAPSGRLTAAVYHDLAEGDPWSQGLSAANSLRALTSARDEGEYFRATGVSFSLETGFLRGVELTLSSRFEGQRSTPGGAKAWLNDAFGGDGILPANPPVAEGDYGSLQVRLEGRAGRARWDVSADGTSDRHFDGKTARLYGQWRQPIGAGTGLTLRVRSGIATRPTLPQLGFRAGGQGSVRGFDYGMQRGDAFWAVQADLSPWRRVVRPVFF
ncbi:MAG TPA: hypothetical protein VJK71_07750, partial [Gemmatimonadales bacterium]|nr:hypothetical protein [Gemmatimonadales bacterium]